MKYFNIILVIILLSVTLYSKDYSKEKEVKVFIEKMIKEHGFNRFKLNRLFANVRFQKRSLGIYNPKYREKPKVVKGLKKKFNKYGSWTRYEKNLFSEKKIDLGVNFMYKHKNIFQKVYEKYGVPPEYITAIIGVESRYGIKRGNYPIFDVLVTLSFEKNRRNSYFKGELESFLILAKNNNFNPLKIKGSYAGAIGLGQFMPSSYKHYAVDYDGDGKRSMQQVPDAIAGVANYLEKNGWKKWEPVAERVSFKGTRYKGKKTGFQYKYSQSELKGLKTMYKWSYKEPVYLLKLERYNFDELWFGARNFYVITRYNHSVYYAMAVHLLAQKIKRGYKKKHAKVLR